MFILNIGVWKVWVV